MQRKHAVPCSRHILFLEEVHLVLKKKIKKESTAEKLLKPSKNKMFLKSIQQSILLTLQWASRYMVFSTFEEAKLLLFHLNVRTPISVQILLLWSMQSKPKRTLKKARHGTTPNNWSSPLRVTLWCPYEFQCDLSCATASFKELSIVNTCIMNASNKFYFCYQWQYDHRIYQ